MIEFGRCADAAANHLILVSAGLALSVKFGSR